MPFVTGSNILPGCDHTPLSESTQQTFSDDQPGGASPAPAHSGDGKSMCSRSVPECPGTPTYSVMRRCHLRTSCLKCVIEHFEVFCLGLQGIYDMEEVQVSHVPGSPRGVPNPGAVRGLPLQPAAFAEAPPLFY